MHRILSVEDDPDFQYLISHILRNQGWEVHYAFTGPEGHEKAVTLLPDLILLDMMLPGLNGIEVFKLLRKQKATRDIPVIVLTAYHADSNFFESEIRALGPVLYLRKPVQNDELVAAIKKLLGERRSAPPAAVWKRGACRIIPESKSVWVGERMIANLAPKRFEVLFHLLQSDAEIAWEDLVADIWGAEGTKNDLEKTVQRLREDLGPEAYRLSTTRKGYKFRA
ncbi:MAG: response regulator transcription factor [Elusimicrobia bacterium]|nr:response regulator transcription factor [Elusimicrobiota bacterium]